mmetsp:Transcript_42540/g.89301  ORF Transcript_42540/g.89301 Transcript_42540/m.89301 type:complete len:104 (+) Transcript_42540:1507-1818(+)
MESQYNMCNEKIQLVTSKVNALRNGSKTFFTFTLLHARRSTPKLHVNRILPVKRLPKHYMFLPQATHFCVSYYVTLVANSCHMSFGPYYERFQMLFHRKAIDH